MLWGWGSITKSVDKMMLKRIMSGLGGGTLSDKRTKKGMTQVRDMNDVGKVKDRYGPEMCIRVK